MKGVDAINVSVLFVGQIKESDLSNIQSFSRQFRGYVCLKEILMTEGGRSLLLYFFY